MKDPISINELVFSLYADFGNKLAFLTVGKDARTISYREFVSEVGLLKSLFERSEYHDINIVLISANSYSWVLIAVSVMCSGNCLVPIDPELSDKEILHQVTVSDSRVIVYADEFSSLFRGNEKAITIEELIKQSKDKNAVISLSKNTPKNYNISDARPAMIVFTSGTTSVPKGVMLSEKNIISIVKGSNKVLRNIGRVFCVLPMNHTYSFICGILSVLNKGEEIVINDRIRNFTKNLKDSQPCMLFAVPLVLDRVKKIVLDKAKESGQLKKLERGIKLSRFLLKLHIDARRKLFKNVIGELGGKLSTVICGGAPLKPETVSFFKAIGIDVYNGYGITECSSLVSVISNMGRIDTGIGSVGKPIHTCRVKIDSPNENGIGEILVSGSNTMLGYYKEPELTDAIFRDGWLYTGDIGYFDRKGYLYIKSRKKNMILLGNGKNIYPEELEAILENVSNISEVIVYLGKNDRLTAEIYSEAGISSEEGIRAGISAVNDRLPLYSQIVEVIFRREPFDKTTSQKIKRR